MKLILNPVAQKTFAQQETRFAKNLKSNTATKTCDAPDAQFLLSQQVSGVTLNVKLKTMSIQNTVEFSPESI